MFNIKELLLFLKTRSLRKAKEEYAYWHGKVEAYELYTMSMYDADEYRRAKGELRKYEARVKSLTEEIKGMKVVEVTEK